MERREAQEIGDVMLAMEAQVARLEAQNKAMAAALEFYGAIENWSCQEGHLTECYCETPAVDNGERARAALSPDAGKGECTCGPAELGPHPAADHRPFPDNSCTFHPDGCPEGSHRPTHAEVWTLEAGQEDLQAQGSLPPEVREQVMDTNRLVRFAKYLLRGMERHFEDCPKPDGEPAHCDVSYSRGRLLQDMRLFVSRLRATLDALGGK